LEIFLINCCIYQDTICKAKIKKREDQWVDTSFLLRIGNKIPMKGVTETKFGAKTKKKKKKKKKDYPEITAPGDPSHNQPPNLDTVAQCQKDFAEGTLL
jgi:hypothetical protein